MSVREMDISKLVEWLGRDGAIAGIEKSDITDSDLCDIAVRGGLKTENKRRRNIAADLVNNSLDFRELIKRHGNDGAIDRLEKSDIKISELHSIATRCGMNIERKQKRSDMIIDIVNHDVVRIDRSPSLLLNMECGDLMMYFKDRKVSRTELLKIMQEIGVYPDPGSNTSLADYAAREISSFGMYGRIAKGTRST